MPIHSQKIALRVAAAVNAQRTMEKLCRAAYQEIYGADRKRLTPKMILQLQQCKSEEARRLLLGVSR